MSKRIVAIVFAVAVGGTMFVLAACGTGKPGGVLGADVTLINNEVRYLQQVERIPRLKDSGALRNVNYNYTAEADPNKIWYLVTQGMNGNPTGYYTIRGPVVDQSAQTTNPDQLSCVYYHSTPLCGTVGLAEPDGVYQSGGENGEYEAVLTDGALLRWGGFYTVSDQPFKVTQTPTIAINENAAISSTDTSRSTGGTVPPRRH